MLKISSSLLVDLLLFDLAFAESTTNAGCFVKRSVDFVWAEDFPATNRRWKGFFRPEEEILSLRFAWAHLARAALVGPRGPPVLA